MQVEIVQFPETRVAAIEHLGSTANVYESTRKLIEWRVQNRVPFEGARTYGVHYDMRTHAESGYRLDIPAGDSERWSPGETKVVGIVPLRTAPPTSPSDRRDRSDG